MATPNTQYREKLALTESERTMFLKGNDFTGRLWKAIWYGGHFGSPGAQILLPHLDAGKAYRIYDVLWSFNTSTFTYSELQELNAGSDGGIFDTTSPTGGTGFRVPYGQTHFASPILWTESKGIWSTGGNVTITYEIEDV